MVRKKLEGHFHVFVPIQRRGEIETLNIEAHILSIFGAEDTVPQNFGGSEVGRSGGEFTWVLYEVPPSRDAYPIGVFFLWTIVDHDASICYNSVDGYSMNLFV